MPGRGEDFHGGAAEFLLGEGVDRAVELGRVEAELLPAGEGEGHAVWVPGQGEIGEVGRSQEETERLAEDARSSSRSGGAIVSATKDSSRARACAAVSPRFAGPLTPRTAGSSSKGKKTVARPGAPPDWPEAA